MVLIGLITVSRREFFGGTKEIAAQVREFLL
jgi:hypothetical protein